MTGARVRGWTAPVSMRSEMPPKPEDPLSASEKETLRRWIERGAEGLPSTALAARTAPETDHWAFATAVRPLPPSLRDGRRARNPVDRFIQHYQRITEHILSEMPQRAELTIALDSERHPEIREKEGLTI